MPGDIGDAAAQLETRLRLEHPHYGEARRHQRRLRVFGQRQIALRPVEHQPRQRLGQGVVDLLIKTARCREGVGEIATHPDRLRSLPRKYECAVHAERVPHPLRRSADRHPTARFIAALPPVSRTPRGEVTATLVPQQRRYIVRQPLPAGVGSVRSASAPRAFIIHKGRDWPCRSMKPCSSPARTYPARR